MHIGDDEQLCRTPPRPAHTINPADPRLAKHPEHQHQKKGRLLPVRETECLDPGVLPRSLRATSTHECTAALV